VLQARSKLIPGIVILLQKLWRGTLCRIQYKKMKAAVYIMNYYRRAKIRKYLGQLQHAFRCCIYFTVEEVLLTFSVLIF
jgi:myosin-1